MGAVPADMVQLCFSAPGFKGFDTALMYSGGKSETLLGEMAGWKGVSEMATKVGERLDCVQFTLSLRSTPGMAKTWEERA